MMTIPYRASWQLLRFHQTALFQRHSNPFHNEKNTIRRQLTFHTKPQTSPSTQVIAHRLNDSNRTNPTVYTPNEGGWKLTQPTILPTTTSWNITPRIQQYVKHFMPANYPASVHDGYSTFASYCFVASVAGSAGMVLSTQTLLLAVGVVGSAGQASILAGAINWVIKDGVGQLGGVLFASKMSQSQRFDASPKRWRMVAALSLDAATLLEIASPFVSPVWVLPLASVANIGKNIGFLTASASRAALHQSLALKQNLADVTAKSGSQSIAAGLIGTTLGIGLSPILGDVTHFAMGFVALSAIHLRCNYLSLKAIPLIRVDRHRLHLILKHYVTTNKVLTPAQVAQQEVFLPGMTPDDTQMWLTIGSSMTIVCPKGHDELELLQQALIGEKYLVNMVQGMVHVVYFHNASGYDLVKGMLLAHMIHYHSCTGEELKDHNFIRSKYDELQSGWDQLKYNLSGAGWSMENEGSSVEDSNAFRIQLQLTETKN